MADIIEDFSFPLVPYSTLQLGIFWDVEDYSFPEEYRDNPDLIYEKISTVLKGSGGVEAGPKISIWAYVDETDEYWKDKLVNKTWKENIYFLPRGDKTARRMYHDILLWAKDTPKVLHPDYCWSCQYLLVIPNQPIHDERFFKTLGVLNSPVSHFIVYIRLPVKVPDWRPWPGRVFVEIYRHFEDAFGTECDTEQGSSEKPKPLPEGYED